MNTTTFFKTEFVGGHSICQGLLFLGHIVLFETYVAGQRESGCVCYPPVAIRPDLAKYIGPIQLPFPVTCWDRYSGRLLHVQSVE